MTESADAITLPVNPSFPLGILPQVQVGQPVEFTGLVDILLHKPGFRQIIVVWATVRIKRN
jgi:hypothetical protein